MPQKVYNNIEGHKIIDNGKTIEDVTKIGLPTLKHPTTSISNVSGMAMDVDMPNPTRIEAADFTIYHNNGLNCQYLAAPGKHVCEVRTVRQVYSTAKGEIKHESVKYIVTGIHVETQKGDMETGSPLGSTEKYSLIRFEEIVDGKETVVIDAMAGIIKYNGKKYTDVVADMLK